MLIETVWSLFSMDGAVVKQEKEVVRQKHHFEDINVVLKLEYHVIVCPTTAEVLAILEESKKQRLASFQWFLVGAAQYLNSCILISTLWT
jgi:hypothetical protein